MNIKSQPEVRQCRKCSTRGSCHQRKFPITHQLFSHFHQILQHAFIQLPPQSWVPAKLVIGNRNLEKCHQFLNYSILESKIHDSHKIEDNDSHLKEMWGERRTQKMVKRFEPTNWTVGSSSHVCWVFVVVHRYILGSIFLSHWSLSLSGFGRLDELKQ